MPRTTVYIRNDDWEHWKLIGNKSGLISEAINRSTITSGEKDNYLEHHVVSEGTVVKRKVVSRAPTDDDLKRMIRELEYRIGVLAESQDPDDFAKAQELYEEAEALKGILRNGKEN